MTTTATTSTEPIRLPNFLASNLRILRKAAGWSQSELAQRLNLNRGNIASYESGLAEPSICKTLRISKLFAVDPRDIIRRDFSDQEELTLAKIAFAQRKEEKRDRIASHQQRADELAGLIKSSRMLFDYKSEKITSPCADAEILAAHYQQLSELTNQLLDNHAALLSELGCQCD
ncbi:helix-turn-helix domain-containing protein [Lewinella sp. 4G2]|uniref:helix-turn-helix domain-containing protein n=1 Tax=Lewinella sp. 4G2 TaxID=1803372 RepID=UPI0007B4E0E7|nr:helix-turn-helix transcriptional regulator [Lewinella sp. 4G2]OAV45450.1 hypothetical protein A3850_013540 [Lewinella sp. 4G2]